MYDYADAILQVSNAVIKECSNMTAMRLLPFIWISLYSKKVKQISNRIYFLICGRTMIARTFSLPVLKSPLSRASFSSKIFLLQKSVLGRPVECLLTFPEINNLFQELLTPRWSAEDWHGLENVNCLYNTQRRSP